MCPECKNCLEKYSKSDKYLSSSKTVLIYKNLPWIPGFGICSMAKNENTEMPEIHRSLPKSKNTHH